VVKLARAPIFLLLLVALGCRTARPQGEPLAPLRATTPEAAMQELRERRSALGTVRTLMRVRVTNAAQTQSFRAQMSVENGSRMTLIAYTPVGTTALTLTADGSQVSVKNHLENQEWEGSAQDLARTFGFLGSSLVPAEVAQLILGLPPREELTYVVTPSGLASARSEDLVVIFEPASFPPKRVTVTRGTDRVEIEHLEVVH
jgi:outer membrane biogenesis lipoprotein LolB